METNEYIRVLFLNLIFVQSYSADCINVLESNNCRAEPNVGFRLPSHLMPEHYRLYLTPFFVGDGANNTIKGHVDIRFKCIHQGTNITFHASNTTASNSPGVQVYELGLNNVNRSIGVVNTSYVGEHDLYIFLLNETTRVGLTYVISIDFVSKIQQDGKGMFKTTYQNKEEVSVYIDLVATQFEAVRARLAFPCLDEPGMKAKFEVSLGRLRNYSSLSNMPIKQRGAPMDDFPDGCYVWDHFEATPPMSTYTLAFAITNFDHVALGSSKSNFKFNIYARPNGIEKTAYASNFSADILEFFEDYFEVSYPLPKQVAMENWGLITYGERTLLYSPELSSTEDKDRIASTISHELVHNWFGNLVTMSWWSDLWLNEGFATYYSHLGVQKVLPGFEDYEQLMLMTQHKALSFDPTAESHPVSRQNITDNKGYFGHAEVTYDKSASIIRMMENFLGQRSFKGGIINYLNNNKYGSVSQDDLWYHLNQQAQKDGTLRKPLTVKEIMDTWTLQSGYPVVHVERDYRREYAEVRQEPFRVSNMANDGENGKAWWVPINFAIPSQNAEGFNDTTPLTWLNPEKLEMSVGVLGMPEEYEPVVFNAQQTGYYRVNYDDKNWCLLADQLLKGPSSVHELNRAQMLDDSLNLAKAGMLDYDIALNITRYLAKEDHYVPLTTALNSLSYISDMLERTVAHGDFKSYVRSLIQPALERLQNMAENDMTHMDLLLRMDLFGWACHLEIDICHDYADDMWTRWMYQHDPDMEGANPIEPDLRNHVYCNAVSRGMEQDWNFALERLNNTKYESERVRLVNSLTCTKRPWQLLKLITWALDKDDASMFQNYEKRSILTQVAMRDPGLTFSYIRKNWKTYQNMYAEEWLGWSMFLMNILMANINERHQFEEIVNFYESHHSISGNTTKDDNEENWKIIMATGEINIKWMEDNYQKVSVWLANVAEP